MTVVVPSALSGLAFVALSRLGAVGDLPLWIPLALLVATSVAGDMSFGRLTRESSLRAVHVAIAVQMLGVASVMYAIGWGPTLTIGYVLILSHALELVGARAWRISLLWSIVGLGLGQTAIAFGLVPTYVPTPYVHGLAVLGLLASAFVMRLLGQKTAENEAANARVSSSLSLLNATLQSTADGMLVLDSDGAVTLWNEQFATMWGLSTDVLRSEPRVAEIAFLVERLVRPDEFAANARSYMRQADAEFSDTVEFKDGHVLEYRTRPQWIDGAIVGRVWSFRDVTERAQLLNQLSHQAFHDNLTGLANRALLRDRIEHALARSRRSAATVAVLFLDVDRFKMVNDSMGHDCGDALLVEIASRLSANLRDGDTAARLGGDEFAVVLEEVRTEDAAHLAQRVLDAIREPFVIKGHEVFVRVSIGIAHNRDEPLDVDELLCRADIAMYAAKNRGRDRYEAFDPVMQSELTARHELYGDLRQALRHGEISLHYQPLVNLAANKIESFEALARWEHPTRGFIPPDEFIPLAEETGLIIELGRHVLEKACRQAQEWRTTLDRAELSISVNVSSFQFHDESFVDDVRRVLAESGLPPTSLILELTESSLLAASAHVNARLNIIKQLGVRIAIDDFGTGYSSLAYLRSFPIDYLKIDRTFVAEITESSGDQGDTMVRSIIGIGHNLQLGVVAEGIEQPEQLQALLAAGCNTGQGYLFAEPVSPEQIPGVLEQFSRELVADFVNEK